MKVNLLAVTTPKRWADGDNNMVSLGSNNEYKLDSWTFGNQLYMSFSFQLDNSLNFLTQSIQPYTNVTITMEDFMGSSRVNYTYIDSNQNKFVLPYLSIIINLSKCEKILCFLCKSKKYLMAAFIKMNGF